MVEPVIALLEKLEREAKGEERLFRLIWPHLDYAIGGMGLGTLLFLAGEAGAGKSLIVSLICLQAEMDG